MTTERILIVDDEETLCEVLRLNLENEGYDVDIAFSAEQALTYDLTAYSLILLDIMMGEISGIKMAKMMKADVKTAAIPIIFCTARDTEDDMVMGLNLGADDYITKPIHPKLLVSRLKAILKRSEGGEESIAGSESTSAPSTDVITIDKERFVVVKNGHELFLPRKEFQLLALLYSKPQKVFSREEIYAAVWGSEVIVGDRTIDVHIRKLRTKIGEDHIVTIKGVGYKYQ